jgi:hypothetical protein
LPLVGAPRGDFAGADEALALVDPCLAGFDDRHGVGVEPLERPRDVAVGLHDRAVGTRDGLPERRQRREVECLHHLVQRLGRVDGHGLGQRERLPDRVGQLDRPVDDEAVADAVDEELPVFLAQQPPVGARRGPPQPVDGVDVRGGEGARTRGRQRRGVPAVEGTLRQRRADVVVVEPVVVARPGFEPHGAGVGDQPGREGGLPGVDRVRTRHQ